MTISMNSPVSLIGVALLVLLLGVAIPVLCQQYQTLKRTRALPDSLAPRLTLNHKEIIA